MPAFRHLGLADSFCLSTPWNRARRGRHRFRSLRRAPGRDLLPAYDLVFGKARCALEALAAGAAVIVCDSAGLAGMVTTGNIDDLRQLNFGARTLTRPITNETIEQELARYDPRDARAVSDKIRAVASVARRLGDSKWLSVAARLMDRLTRGVGP